MFGLIFISALFVFAIGGVAKFILDKRESELRITWPEFGIAGAIMLAIVIPVTSMVGTKMAYDNAVTFNEFWGGYEKEAVWIKTTCYRDGPCVHEYDCDPYQVYVVDRSAYTDDKGNYHPEQGHYETRYHDCPYTTEEWTFVVTSTLPDADYTIAYHNFPTNPSQHRWEPWRGHSLRTDVESGIPAFWQAAKNRIDSGQPGPVTARKDYENYVLASQNTILKQYSGDIEAYKKAGLLPKLNGSISQGPYFADRVYFVGKHRPAGDWQKAGNYFAGAFGSDLQGDLHVVIVDADAVNDPDTYIMALSAYWQGPEFGKDALSKNGVIVVLGTSDGATVAWARAATGMPKGNEGLILDVKNQLVGTALTPEAIFGPPMGTVSTAGGKTTVSVRHGAGALDKVFWGDNKFQRIRMREYKYLSSEIEPTSGQKNLIIFMSVLFGCIAWGICIFAGPQTFHQLRRR
jgi:hypothetical protein